MYSAACTSDPLRVVERLGRSVPQKYGVQIAKVDPKLEGSRATQEMDAPCLEVILESPGFLTRDLRGVFLGAQDRR
jgi:hypothetical protein